MVQYACERKEGITDRVGGGGGGGGAQQNAMQRRFREGLVDARRKKSLLRFVMLRDFWLLNVMW